MDFKSQARRDGIDLEYEHQMQEQSERESRFLSHGSNDSQMAVVSPRRVPRDMDESLACIDLEYEHWMQQKLCSLIEGANEYFMHRDWVLGGSTEEVLLRVDPNQPVHIPVHTHVRSRNDEALVHDQHPFLAGVYLLRNAEAFSTVYVSAPFVTDMHFLDELCHFAKTVAAGGKDLKIRVVLGPQRWVTEELQRFVRAFSETGSQLREEAIGRLAVRRFGTDNNDRSSYCHSKAMVSTAGAMVGSYNYTYASRYRHREDGVFMPPGAAVDNLRARLHSIWDAGEPVSFRRSRPPPGYIPPAPKQARVHE
ncbi:hypothetical protein IV203_037923 [Nitzschia inconspicua]|uniref:Phospholipase D-like domain-containing protein n=1 Tax=Nitzschia inconspicua TaxID=303405 RepID=A0A9K3PZ08_9STRA|nr:hypothetical protein IV203_037923 [Nitzschia inconspicua]